MEFKNQIIKKLLEKLLAEEYIGARHTAFENLSKGFPKHLRGEANKVARDLIKAGHIIRKITSYGEHVSLNKNRIEGIVKIIRDP